MDGNVANPFETGPQESSSKPSAKTNAMQARWSQFNAAHFGTVWILHSEAGVHALDFDAPDGLNTAYPLASNIAEPLQRYFSGEPIDLNAVPVAPQGTVFQKRVWNALRSIPFGQVRTYGQIATQIGSPRAMRAVGMANKRNPIAILVPCHRVIESTQGLGGYNGGLDRKRHLLRLEGARVVDDKVLPGQLGLGFSN
ncbi:MAG: methylated-DNA--[protein]-cysteine S-methyltransferase [Polyangiales bacterium]